jgi:adenosylhomocysteine nucleosidase
MVVDAVVMRAIFASLDLEIKPLRQQLEVDSTLYLHPGRVWHGRLGTQEVCLARAGMGIKAMLSCAQACFRLFHPTEALLIGFGGAATPLLHPGQLVLATQIQHQTLDQTWTPTSAALETGQRVCAELAVTPHLGIAVTSDNVVAAPHDKAFLGTRFDAAVVEMEGAGFAQAATTAEIPWLMVRGIVDSMEDHLPDGLAPFRADGTLSYTRVVRYLMRHPRAIAQMSTLHMTSERARKQLVAFAQAWLTA